MNDLTPAPSAEPGSGGALLNLIAQAATNPDVDVQKLQALLDMQQRVLKIEAERSFNHALARVSAEMPRVRKDGRIKLVKDGVDKGSLPFARWEDIDTVIRPLMRQEGFTLSFNTRTNDKGVLVIVGRLLHKDGHWSEADFPLPPDTGPGRNALQALGSTLSYGKRYCAEMLLNIVRAGADDDGTAGGTQFLSREQVVEIETALTELGVPRDAFLSFMAAGSVEEIKLADYRKAMNSLATKRRQQGAQR